MTFEQIIALLQEGADARTAGRNVFTNPYARSQSINRVYWRKGWYERDAELGPLADQMGDEGAQD